MAEFAVSFYKPGAYFLLLPRLEHIMGERAGAACSARADLEKFAWYVREILGCSDGKGRLFRYEAGRHRQRTYSSQALSPSRSCPCPSPCRGQDPVSLRARSRRPSGVLKWACGVYATRCEVQRESAVKKECGSNPRRCRQAVGGGGRPNWAAFFCACCTWWPKRVNLHLVTRG